MDIKDFVSDIWQNLKSLYYKIKYYCLNNKLQALIIAFLLLLIILLFILLGVFTKSKSKKSFVNEKEFVLTENLLIPTSPEIQENYSISRMKKDNWNDEEADEWFSIPTQKDIDSLSKTNNSIISDIIGAAP